MADDQEFKMKYGFGVIEKYYANKTQLQTGIDIQKLGFDYGKSTTQPLYTRFISPFIEDNHSQPDPLQKPTVYYSTQKPNLTTKKELFQQFSDETLFYIFYNMMDETQQLWAVDNLYARDWQYNHKLELWVRDLERSGVYYSCKYFSCQNCKVMENPQIEINLMDFCTVDEFYASSNV